MKKEKKFAQELMTLINKHAGWKFQMEEIEEGIYMITSAVSINESDLTNISYRIDEHSIQICITVFHCQYDMDDAKKIIEEMEFPACIYGFGEWFTLESPIFFIDFSEDKHDFLYGMAAMLDATIKIVDRKAG